MSIQFQKILFFLLIFFLPSQLGFHFWPSWSYFSGLPVDYLSPTLYFTDLLIISLLIFWFFSHHLSLKHLKYLFLFISLALLNIFISPRPPLTAYSWFRCIEYFLFAYYLYSNRSLLLSQISLPLALSSLWVSILAWFQFIFQHSLGGLWYWLGERTFTVTSPLIAKVSLGSAGLYLRSYSVFPHPNALAAFLLLSCLLILFLNSHFSPRSLTLARPACLISLLTIPLTFSRTIILFELGFLCLYLYFRYRRQISLTLLLSIVLPGIALGIFALSLGNPDSLPERLQLIAKAIHIIISHPLAGIGLGNFITTPYSFPALFAPLSFQPVHNIFLLLASELGLPLVILLTYFLVKSLINLAHLRSWQLFTALLLVLFSGMLDHYWLTIHQNSLLLAILFSLVVIQFSHDHC